jgi:hypothetical protein
MRPAGFTEAPNEDIVRTIEKDHLHPVPRSFELRQGFLRTAKKGARANVDTQADPPEVSFAAD